MSASDWILFAVEIIKSLLFTAFIYGCVPIIVALSRKSKIKSKAFRWISIIWAIVVWFLLAVVYITLELDGVPGMWPAVIWCAVANYAGQSILRKRKLLVETNKTKTTDEDAAKEEREPE